MIPLQIIQTIPSVAFGRHDIHGLSHLKTSWWWELPDAQSWTLFYGLVWLGFFTSSKVHLRLSNSPNNNNPKKSTYHPGLVLSRESGKSGMFLKWWSSKDMLGGSSHESFRWVSWPWWFQWDFCGGKSSTFFTGLISSHRITIRG